MRQAVDDRLECNPVGSQVAAVRHSARGVDAADQMVGDAVILEARTFAQRPALPRRRVDRRA